MKQFFWWARLWFWIVGSGFVCLWMLIRFWVEDRVDDLRRMFAAKPDNVIYLDRYR